MKKLIMSFYLFLFVACASTQTTYSPEEIAKESSALNQFFETDFQEAVDRSPEFLTFMGSKKKYEQLDDNSYANFLKEQDLAKASLEKLKQFDPQKLDAQAKISYDLYKYEGQAIEKSKDFYFHSYFVNQMYGRHTGLISFMLNEHSVSNEPEAWSYISRLEAFEKAIDDVIAKLETQKEKGIKYPNFIFAHVIRDCKNIVTGFPFQNIKRDSDLYKDFRTKVARIPAEPKIKNILMNKAKLSMNRYVKQGYEKLISYLEQLEKESPESNGVWALPDGDKFYAYRLKKITTTDLSPSQIHKLGLSEVAKVHAEMKDLMQTLNFKGTLKEFFAIVKNNPKLFYPNTYRGKQNYLKDTKDIIAAVEAKTDQLFNVKPKAKLVVKPVEEYREKSAGVAFYESPAPDGSRPGIYYVNMADMSTIPKYDMEALAYHEAVPGHHMQLSIAQELEGLPKFRLFGGYTAYAEGWGLYAEKLPKEIGFYTDPYSDFGRLSMELWRAARLVVDTGIHHYKWSREKAIDYLTLNTPNSMDKNTKEIERYFVLPGQATAYKMGQLKIIELRQKAEKRLQAQFDLKEFHDVILKNGALPFTILEQVVDTYIKTKLKSTPVTKSS
jgi:uncharacterized protein (DUF885 family)